MIVRALSTVLLLALLTLAACRQQPPGNASQPDVSNRVFQVKGTVQELFPDRNQVKIAHERIPDYMEAMTMTFAVKNPAELTDLKAGDVVHFRMVVTADDGWIENVRKAAAVSAHDPPAKPTFRVVREVEPLNVGDTVPDYAFTNELGQAVGLHDFKGQAIAVTFLFTRCPFPTFCPRMASNFAAAQKKLSALPNAPTNWHLLTITFDPEYDTPTVLRDYARRFAYNPDKWSFLTGELIDITAFAEQFQMLFWRPDPSKPAGIEHNLRTVVIDPQGRVQRIIPENEWKVDDLVQEIVKAAQSPG